MDAIARCFLLLSLVYIPVLQRYAHCRWFRRVLRITLLVWAAAVLWITTLSRSPGSGFATELIPFHSYRKLLAGADPEILRTNFMNAALFYPAGVLAASLLPKDRPRWQQLLALGIPFALFSLAIEYAQFRFALGRPEIDDVLHNTVGAVCGAVPIILRDLLHDPTR